MCLLLVFSFDNGWAQTTRRKASAVSRGATTTPAARVVNLAIDVREAQLLGSFNGRVWSDALKTMPLVKKGETFRLYSLTGSMGTGVVSEIVPPEYPCDDIVGVNISPLPEGEGDIIGLNGTWNAQPRLPKIQSTDQQEYRAVVSNYLKGVGVSNPKVAIFQLLRVDLDGDGVMEVITTFQSIFDGGKNVYEVKGRKPRQVFGWYCSGGH